MLHNYHIYCSFFFSAFIGSGYAQVSPLMSTTWNQTCYYNEMMPTVGSGGSCGKAYTGCNATALAQICKYYAYPTSGFDSHCNSNFPSYCADFESANYLYGAMPNNVTSSNTQVATLMHDLGVAVDMSWSGSNSTSFFSSTVLKKHFAYSPAMYGTATFMFPGTSELILAIKKELDAGRPVFCKGGGHFYLIDGYNFSDQFHMNFGWGGTYDGYYPIDNVINGAGTFTPSNFIFEIRPMNGDLELARDTIFISPYGVSAETLEFTSKSDWSISTSEPWINPNLTTGSKGYFDFSQASYFSASINNGPERIAYIYVSNATDIDTFVVVQGASLLQVTPNPVVVNVNGGSQLLNVTHDSWANWTAITSDSWLHASPASGTGSASITLTVDDNSGGPERSAYVIVTGVFTDSVLVIQEADVTNLTVLEQNSWQISPNPSKDEVNLIGVLPNQHLAVYDVLGNLVILKKEVLPSGTIRLDFTDKPRGIYLIQGDTKTERVLLY